VSLDSPKVGEREAAATLNAVLGCNARRGVQYRGGPDSPDLVTDFPGLHFEVKRTERLKLWEALSQAETDAKGTVPVVLHRANNRPWVAIVRLADIGILSAILRSTHTPSLNLSGTSGDRPSVSVGSTDVEAGSR
jgi:hypothetical protein